MKKRRVVAVMLCLFVVFAFAACGEKEEPTMAEENKTEIKEEQAANESNENFGELSQSIKAEWDQKYQFNGIAVGGVGDTLSNDFFDWTIHSVKTAKETHGKSAGEGKKFVIINMTMTNTEDFEYETGNFEFLALVGTSEDDELNTMDAFYDGMIGDEFTLGVGESVTGDIVFKVDEDIDTIVVDYEEFYGDNSIGNVYWYEIKL